MGARGDTRYKFDVILQLYKVIYNFLLSINGATSVSQRPFMGAYSFLFLI